VATGQTESGTMTIVTSQRQPPWAAITTEPDSMSGHITQSGITSIYIRESTRSGHATESDTMSVWSHRRIRQREWPHHRIRQHEWPQQSQASRGAKSQSKATYVCKWPHPRIMHNDWPHTSPSQEYRLWEAS
jgi:hypothetical protein